jgi:hypothetical protein
MRINESEVQYAQYSLIDNIGRVFHYNGRIYRGINHDYEKFVRDLLNSGLINELIGNKLFPQTTITDLQLEGYSLVLEHELLFFSNPYEWTFDMLKDAALLTLKVDEIALKFGYQLKDAHPYNILFKNNRPFFIDLGSFAEENTKYSNKTDEFLKAFCLPIILASKNQSFTAHKLLVDPSHPYSRLLVGEMPFELYKHIVYLQEFRLLIFNYSVSIPLKSYFYKLAKFSERVFKRMNIKNLRGEIRLSKNIYSKIEFIDFKGNTFWSNYQDEYFKNGTLESTDRFDFIVNYTKSLTDAESAIDIAANQGLLPVLLNNEIGIPKIIHLDYDINANNLAYLYYRDSGLSINIICANFRWLVYDDIFCKRLESDIVYGLALTHHLILTQNMPLEPLLSAFYKITKKYVFIEFMPLGLWNGHSSPSIPDWYTLEWFRNGFVRYFTLLDEKKIADNRIIFIGKKRI